MPRRFLVLLTTGGFVLLALKYIEISWRNPEGGGVGTITTKASGPMWGCLGGMLIIVDYFLTTAISAVAGFQYVGSIVPAIDSHILILACGGIITLTVLNIIGIRESAAAEGLTGVVSLAEAVELKALYPSSTLLAVRGENSRLIQEGITRAKGKQEAAIYCIYVEEWPGLFDGSTPHMPNDEGIRTLTHALHEGRDKNIEIIPIWSISHNAAEAIAAAAKRLGSDAVLVGATQRSAFYHMLRGHVVSGLMSRLPRNCHLMICN